MKKELRHSLLQAAAAAAAREQRGQQGLKNYFRTVYSRRWAFLGSLPGQTRAGWIFMLLLGVAATKGKRTEESKHVALGSGTATSEG